MIDATQQLQLIGSLGGRNLSNINIDTSLTAFCSLCRRNENEEAIPLPQACVTAADAAHNFVLLPAAAHAATTIAATAVANHAEARCKTCPPKDNTAAGSALRDPKAATYRDQVHMAAEQLDIWAQAEAELGAMDKGQDQEGRLKAYLLHELDFSYGPGHVAAINPVWDQSELERLLREFNQVPPAGEKCVGGEACIS